MIFSEAPNLRFLQVRDHYSHKKREVRGPVIVNLECL